MRLTPPLIVALLAVVAPAIPAQDRATKVRNDRKAFANSPDWIYNDLDAGLRAATAQGKPLMVVFRCIPCEACQEFDDDVAARDPILRDLLDQYVCVRIVQANTIDLTRFHFDFDQSFAVVLMHPDGTLYGRYGTRSGRPESEDLSLHGLRAALAEGLRMHARFDAVKPSLAGKQVPATRYRKPLDYPSLARTFTERLDYEGEVVRSCLHCHQIREAERRVYREAGQPLPDEVLYPYPDPEVLGLKLDPRAMATVETVDPGSIADIAGLRAGDAITTLQGQPLLSIADLQWVLHTTPAAATTLNAEIVRDGRRIAATLALPASWRRGDLSWRVTTWDLRRMALGGLRLEDLSDDERAEAKFPVDTMALRVRHVGQFGEHALAKNAGFRNGDRIVAFNGRTARMTESDLIADTLQRTRPGEEVAVEVLRDGRRTTLRFRLP